MSDSEDCASEPGELMRFRRPPKGEPKDSVAEDKPGMDVDASDDDCAVAGDDEEVDDEAERLLLPGDLALSDESGAKYVLGVGLRPCLSEAATTGSPPRLEVRATRAGFLRSRGRSYWLDCPTGRYHPVRGDCVLGVVTRRPMGDSVQVDIGCSEPAALSLLTFENATKRNRPDVRLGDLVYCRLTRCESGLEPELACVDSSGRAGGFGVVGRDTGALVAVPPALARRLATERQLLALLHQLGEFESTVGSNGRLWLCGTTWLHTVALAGAASAFHMRPEPDCQRLVADLLRARLLPTAGVR